MEKARHGRVVNETSTYSQIIEFQSLADVDAPPPSLSRLSRGPKTKLKDDFVQRNPLIEPDVVGTSRSRLRAVDRPSTDPEAVTTPDEIDDGYYYQIELPEETEIGRYGGKTDRSKTGNGSGPLATTVHAQYSVRYAGSVRLPEGDLIGDKSAATMTQCITTLAKGSKKTNKIVHEFKENQKVILKLEERELQIITDDKNAKVILCHPLRKIRAWAVGKETDSCHFAYLIRNVPTYPDDSAGYSYICRVFKCSVKAREIATALRNICQRRAAMRADKNS